MEKSVLSKDQYHLALDVANRISEYAPNASEMRLVLVAIRKLLEVSVQNNRESLESPL